MRLIIAALMVCSLARADVSDREIARKRYEMGVLLFQHGKYADALKELLAAKAAMDRPEFDYNIGLCLAKLGRDEEAADALERFVTDRPNDAEAPAIRRRITELRRHAQPETPPPPPPREAAPPPREAAPPPREAPPPSSSGEPMPPGEVAARAAAVDAALHPPPPRPPSAFSQFVHTPHGAATFAMGGVTLAVLLTASITGGLAISNDNYYHDTCFFNCVRESYDTARSLAIATDVFIGVGVAAAITTVALAVTRPKTAKLAQIGVLRW